MPLIRFGATTLVLVRTEVNLPHADEAVPAAALPCDLHSAWLWLLLCRRHSLPEQRSAAHEPPTCLTVVHWLQLSVDSMRHGPMRQLQTT